MFTKTIIVTHVFALLFVCNGCASQKIEISSQSILINEANIQREGYDLKPENYVVLGSKDKASGIIVQLHRNSLKGKSYQSYLNQKLDSPESRLAIRFHVGLGNDVDPDLLKSVWPDLKDQKNSQEKLNVARSQFPFLNLEDALFQNRFDIDGVSIIKLVLKYKDLPIGTGINEFKLDTTIHLDRNATGKRLLNSKKPDWLLAATKLIQIAQEQDPVVTVNTKGLLGISFPPKAKKTLGPYWQMYLPGNPRRVFLNAGEWVEGDLAPFIDRVIAAYREGDWEKWLTIWAAADRAKHQTEVEKIVSDPEQGDFNAATRSKMGHFRKKIHLLYEINFGSYAAVLIEDHYYRGKDQLFWMRFIKDEQGQWKLTQGRKTEKQISTFPEVVFDILNTDYVKLNVQAVVEGADGG